MLRILKVLSLAVLTQCAQATKGSPRHASFTSTKQSYIYWPAGTSLSLKCEAAGAAPLKVRWYKDDIILGNSHAIYQDSQGNLRFRKPKVSDNGIYTCLVSDKFEGAKHSYNLRVLKRIRSSPEIFPGYPKSITARVGDSVALECLEKPTDQLNDYRWLRSKSLIANDPIESSKRKNGTDVIMDPSKYETFTKEIGDQNLHGVKLYLDNVSEDDEGFYTCFVSNGMGSTHGTAYLNVTAVSPTDPPEFIIPKDRRQRLLAEIEGNDVTLSCLVRGGPPLKFRWFFNGEPVNTDERHKINNGEMTVKNIRLSDKGIYSCSIKNDYGSIKHHFKLYILRKQPSSPVLLPGYPKNKTAIVGETVSLDCTEISNDKLVDYRWLKWYGNRTSITKADLLDKSLYTVIHPEYYEISKENGMSLNLRNLSHEDQGLYTCFVSNANGYTYNSAFLSVREPVQEQANYTVAALVEIKESNEVRCYHYEGKLPENTAVDNGGECRINGFCGSIYEEKGEHWQMFCDETELCKQNGISGEECVDVTIKGREVLLCCCVDKFCNKPATKLFTRKTKPQSPRQPPKLTTLIFLCVLILTFLVMLALLAYKVRQRKVALAETIVHNTRPSRKLTKRMIMETKWLKEDV